MLQHLGALPDAAGDWISKSEDNGNSSGSKYHHDNQTQKRFRCEWNCLATVWLVQIVFQISVIMPVVERYAAPLSAPLTKPEFVARAGHFAEEAGVKEGAHKYFTQHRSRLWTTGSHFDLWNLKGKSVLEIGPFYSYIPFLLAEQKNSVTVLEGDDPAVNPLIPIYKRLDIEVVIADLFENFGTANLDRHRLPFDENQFDIVNCWETMEHFNFNPVGFVQEVRRILKPGGLAFITVPNIAKLDWRIRLLLGKPISPVVSSYFEILPLPWRKIFGMALERVSIK
jgi:SAM-dependent methyltransferase